MTIFTFELKDNLPETERWMLELGLETEAELEVYKIMYLYTKEECHFIGSVEDLSYVLKRSKEEIRQAISKLVYRNLLVKYYRKVDVLYTDDESDTVKYETKFTPMYRTHIPENITGIIREDM